jgi:hypothetical protein
MNTSRYINHGLVNETSEIDYLVKSEIKGENIIDSRNIQYKVKKLLDMIVDKNSSSVAVIKISDFICNKLSDIYRLSVEKRNIIVNQLQEVVLRDNELKMPVRLYYLRFRNEVVPYIVSCNLYDRRICNNISIIPYFQILKYILNSYLVEDNITQRILNEFEVIFGDENYSDFIKMEIADIYLLNNRHERGNEMLQILRQRERERDEVVETVENRVIYTDSQNVHSTTINNSVLKVSVKLIELEQVTEFDKNEVIKALTFLSPSNASHIHTVIERIEIDVSRFIYGDNNFKLQDVFSSLWSYLKKFHHYCQYNDDGKCIISDEHDIQKILIDEIVAMSKYCSSGHLSRFINVIQGYTNNEDLQIRISDQEQIKAVIFYYLDKVLANAPPEIIDSMIDDNNLPFLNYICEQLNLKIPMVIKDYGNVQEYIISAVKSYSKHEWWSISSDNILTLGDVEEDIGDTKENAEKFIDEYNEEIEEDSEDEEDEEDSEEDEEDSDEDEEEAVKPDRRLCVIS